MAFTRTVPAGKGSMERMRTALRGSAGIITADVTSSTPLPLTVSVPELRGIATKLRRHVIRMTAAAGSGHPGGSLSAADILATLYFAVMRHNPDQLDWPDRDRFILSKGHAAPVLYAALAECGYFPVDDLITLRKLDSHLQGHPDITSTPGVEASTGSLGQGFSAGNGHALAARLDARSYRVYVLLGCGEHDEGQVWEAAMFAAHQRLDNVVAVIDYNHLQIDGRNEEVVTLEPLVDKWRAFGWHTIELDGHDFPALLAGFAEAERTKGRPTAIIAQTVKGKGVSFMEGKVDFHGKAPTAEEAERALSELADEAGQDAAGEGQR